MGRSRFNIGWAPDIKRGHPRLALSGPWSAAIARIMRERRVGHLELDWDWKGKDLEFLRELPELEGLTINHHSECDLDLAPIEGLAKLWTLHLTADDFKGRLDLPRLPELKELEIWSWPRGRFVGLALCRKLRFLGVGMDGRPGLGVEDVAAIAGMKDLRFLTLTSAKMRDFRWAAGIKKLETIYLYDARQLETLDGLDGCAGLKRLTIMNAPKLDSIDALAGAKALRHLELSYCPKLASLRPLAGHPRLACLMLDGNTRVNDGDLSPLKRLPRLAHAWFEDRKHYTHKSEEFPKEGSEPTVEPKPPLLPGPAAKRVPPMNADKFWKLVEASARAGGGKRAAQCAALRKLLAPLTAEEIQAFQSRFDAEMDRAYSWELWGAAYVIAGGCSDDGFMDFRSWLISRGRKVFESAIKIPDSLAGVLQREDKDGQFESFQYVARQALERSQSDEPIEETPRRAGPKRPRGKRWKEDGEELRKRYPRLWERFGK